MTAGRKLHERTQPTSLARLDIDAAVLAAVQKHDLTMAETVYVLAQLTRAWAIYPVREERGQLEDEAPRT